MGAFFTISEAADSLGITSSRLRRMCNRNEIASVRTSGGHRRIPMDEVQRLAAQAPHITAGHDASLPTILVADDNAIMRKAFEIGLRQLNVSVEITCVDTGLSAIVHTERLKPAILIIDLEMGPDGFDGLRIIKAIVESTWYNHLPIVAVSGLDPVVVKTRGGIPPDVLMFQKPLDWSRFKGCLEGLLHLRRLC